MNAEGTSGIDTALIIAILSLLSSLATLFVSYLSPGRIRCSFGPTITVFYDELKFLLDIKEGKPGIKTKRRRGHPLYIYIPATFINSGSRTGSIFRISLALHKTETPHQTYSMDWRAFCSFHRETGIWAEDELAHQVSIKGNSTEAKWVSFYWGLNPPIELLEGSYELDIYYWNNIGSLPKHEKHELHITPLNMIDIRSNLKGNRDMVELFLDDKNRRNNLTNQHEIGKLIDEKSKGFIAKTTQIAWMSIGLGALSILLIYLVETSIAQPYHVDWWLNPRIIMVLASALPFILGCIFASGSSLIRLWQSRKIIASLRQRIPVISVQLIAPFAGILLAIISIAYIAGLL